jgi:hypothetical protein
MRGAKPLLLNTPSRRGALVKKKHRDKIFLLSMVNITNQELRLHIITPDWKKDELLQGALKQ